MKKLLFILTITYLFYSCGNEQEKSLTGHTNFVILFADDLGYGDLSSYGHPTILTPNLDQMGREGIRFTSFYAGAPVCTPSRAALLTGRYAARIGLPNVLGPDNENGIDASEITIAEALKEKGYATKAVGKWHLGSTKPHHMPTANGFDSYFGILYSNDMMPPWVQSRRPLSLYRDTTAIEHPVDQRGLTVRYTQEATQFIKENKEKPFFLYLAYSMPHLPIFTMDTMRDRSLAGLYGDVIQTIDWSAGRILEELKSQGLDENTLVVFTSDNGPWLNLPVRMLQEGNQPWHAGSPGLLRGAKGSTYEGGIRVPALFRWPTVIPGERLTAEMASVLDLFPTIMTAAGVEMSNDRQYDGNDLMSLLTGQSRESGTEEFFYFRSKNVKAVREGVWKLSIEGNDTIPELYNLNLDPSERYDRSKEFPDLTDNLLNKIRNMQNEIDKNYE